MNIIKSERLQIGGALECCDMYILIYKMFRLTTLSALVHYAKKVIKEGGEEKINPSY